MQLINHKNMKLIKSTIFASLALAAAALTGCSDDNNYNAGAASNGAYFPDNLESAVESSNKVSVYEVPVYRVSADSPTSYEVTSTVTRTVSGNLVPVSEGFSIPSTVTFDGSSTQTTLPITYDLEKIEQDVAYNVTLVLVNPSDYGNSQYEFTLTVTAPKVREAWDGSLAATEHYPAVEGKDASATGYYTLSRMFTGEFADMEIYKEYNPEGDPDKSFNVIFANMFDWYDNSTGIDFKIVIPDTDNRDEDGNILCEVPAQAINYPGYNIIISDRYSYLTDVLEYDKEEYADWKQACTFNPSTGMFNIDVVYYPANSTGYYGYGAETAQLDGYPRCTLSISYAGIVKDLTQRNYVAADFTSGEDTNIIKAVIVPTDGNNVPTKVAQAAEFVESQSYQEVEAGEGVRGEFLVTQSGTYYLIGVTYDSNGDAQDFDVVDLYAELTPNEGEGWTTLGTATFTDGWFLSLLLTRPGNYPWDIEVRESKDNPGWYLLINPYNCDNFMDMFGDYNYYSNYHRNIAFYIMDENYVEVLPQLAGVGNPSYAGYMGSEELAVSNMEGRLYANYANSGYTRKQIETIIGQTGMKHSTCDKNMIITIPSPYIRVGYEGQYQWIQATSEFFGSSSGMPSSPNPCQIIMPEASLKARAMHAAKSVAKPTFISLSSTVASSPRMHNRVDPVNLIVKEVNASILAHRK
jgi:hypothetical protein